MEKTGSPIAGGVLSIVAGAIHIFGFLGCMIALIYVPAHVGIILGIVGGYLLITGILPIIGGIYALQRKKWELALAGSIIAILGSLILGVLATIFIAISRDEFE